MQPRNRRLAAFLTALLATPHIRDPSSAVSTPQLERAWDAWQAEQYQRGEIGQRPGYTDNQFRPCWRSSCATGVVQETGRSGGAEGSIVTGTP